MTEHEVGPGAYGVGIAADGAVWTSLVPGGELVRLDPDGRSARIELDSPQSRPMVLTSGTDGDLWFSRGDGFLGHIDHAGTISSHPLTTSATPYGICAGPEQTLWYTLVDGDRVGRMTADGHAEEFPVPAGSMPSLLSAGADGTLWLTLNQANAVGTLSLTGALTTYELPTADGAPVGICASPDGAWFAEIGAGQIGHIGIDGAIEEFPLPDRSSKPHAVATTSDGGCWATLWASSSAVRLDRQGRIVDEVHFTTGGEPHGVAIAADGSAWVALQAGSLAHIAAG
ncbi:virginiamycin B lyase [Ruania zhangjianzhongii]|uniref:Vgb family protein n=1 Tax=Ruania zhangjianzhongii TaxID=2603206 RepID=UPI0011C99251|nr:virginiamycin B lyase [Ruania zhangjianzhongii]